MQTSEESSRWFVAIIVDEHAVPLTFDFTDAADAYRALRQVRARHPLAYVRRATVARLARRARPENHHA